MQILRLTDLHYSPDRPFQKALIEALLKDLKQQVADGFSPGFIVFSGDLVDNPDEIGVYQEFEAKFLRPLLLAVNLVEKEVVFCPGNHDVSHTVLRDWSDERKKLKAALTLDPAELSKLLKSGTVRLRRFPAQPSQPFPAPFGPNSVTHFTMSSERLNAPAIPERGRRTAAGRKAQ
jgi:predicted MPP superfamily phosphohydrolase